MILLIGASTYVGRAFARALRCRKDPFIPLSQSAFDYTQFEFLFDYVRKTRPEMIINAEEMRECLDTNGPEADPELLNSQKLQMLQANTLLAQTIARVCSLTNTPWAHVSSGSIYSGAKILERGKLRVERNLADRRTRQLFEAHPDRFRGYTELDEPNSSFKCPPFSFYSGTKALAEEAIRNQPNVYIWRLGFVLSQTDDPANLLSQLRDSPRVREGLVSVSHVEDCVRGCLELWDRRAPFGIYNVVNPGTVSTRELLQLVHHLRKPSNRFQLMVCDNETLATEQPVPGAECILDDSKLRNAGVKLRNAREAVDHSLAQWEPCSSAAHRILV